MRKVGPGRVSQRSVSAEEAGGALLRDCFPHHHGAALAAGSCAREFLDFLDATPADRHSAQCFRCLTAFQLLPPPGAGVVETGGSAPIPDLRAAEVGELPARLNVEDHCKLVGSCHMQDIGAALLARLAAAGGDTGLRGGDHFFAFRKAAGGA
jgi:hypothetical protein